MVTLQDRNPEKTVACVKKGIHRLIVGIDIGSTTTKAVVIEGDRLLCKIRTKAVDAVTSATGALGKLTIEQGYEIRTIERILVTGVGASRIHRDIFDIPTHRIEEVTAIGYGGKYLSKMMISSSRTLVLVQ